MFARPYHSLCMSFSSTPPHIYPHDRWLLLTWHLHVSLLLTTHRPATPSWAAEWGSVSSTVVIRSMLRSPGKLEIAYIGNNPVMAGVVSQAACRRGTPECGRTSACSTKAFRDPSAQVSGAPGPQAPFRLSLSVQQGRLLAARSPVAKSDLAPCILVAAALPPLREVESRPPAKCAAPVAIAPSSCAHGGFR